MATPVTSLAKSAGLLGGVLEKYKEQLLAPVVQPFSEGSGVDYVGFCDPKSKNLTDLIAAGINIGTAYARVNGKYEQLNNFEFHLLSAKQLWVNFDQNGAAVGVTNVDPRSYNSPYKENIEAAIIVYTSKGAVPAKCTFRTTKAHPGRVANKELTGDETNPGACSPEWAKISKAHAAVAGAFPLGTFPPGFRFFTQVSINKGTSKGKLLPIYLATGKPVLTTPEKSKELEQFLVQSDAKERISAVMDSYTARVKELTEKIK